MPPETRHYAFEDFRVDVDGRRLHRRSGEQLPLPPRAFDALLYLIEHRGRLLEKEEMLSALWPGRVVEENNLTQCVSMLRRTLDDHHGQFILTVPGRGYRFVAVVRAPENGAEDAVPGPVKSVAVLPFKPLVEDQRNDALLLGMTELLITRLSVSRELAVWPLGLVRRYSGAEQDPVEAGRALGVEAVLDGAVLHSADRLRVTCRLLRTRDGVALWAGAFDERFADVFAVQDAMTERVVRALAIPLGGETLRRLYRRETENVDAYQLYLSGRHHASALTPQSMHSALALYQQAIALDPGYALAHAGIADVHMRTAIAGELPPAESFPRAEAAAQRALSLDPGQSHGHYVLGFVRFWFNWDWVGAEREFSRAIELAPAGAEAHLGAAHLSSNLGCHERAIAEIRLACELDPMSLLGNTLEAMFLSAAGRNDEALKSLQRVFDLEPNFWVARLRLAGIQMQRGQFQEALANLRTACEHSGPAPNAIAARGFALAVAGDRAGANASLQELESMAARRHVPASNFALVHCGLGEVERALDWLERAHRERDLWMTFLKVDGRWDRLRGEPRFRQVYQAMAFPEA